MDLITLDVEGDWALKLGNLKRFKSSLESYLENELKVPFEKVNNCLLGSIANNFEVSDFLKIMELVFIAFLNSSKKQEFIQVIQELDENDQYNLMYFIKKTISKKKTDIFHENEIKDKEIEFLTIKKEALMRQVIDLQREISLITKAKDALSLENEELKVNIFNLQNELDSLKQKPDVSSDLYYNLEKNLIEKGNLLEIAKQMLEDGRNHNERQITELKEEVDKAQADREKLAYCELLVNKYKKYQEKWLKLKKKQQNLKKENENMSKLIKKHQFEEDSKTNYKEKIRKLAEELKIEKNKTQHVQINLEMKERHTLKLNEKIEELNQKLKSIENNRFEKKILKNLSFGSDNESIESSSNEKHLDFKTLKTHHEGSSISNLNFNGKYEDLAAENLRLKANFLKKKQKCRQLKELNFMQYEDLISTVLGYSTTVAFLQNANSLLSEKLNYLSETIENCENLKKKQNFEWQLNDLKANNEKLLGEIKNLYNIKQENYKKYIEAREECIKVRNENFKIDQSHKMVSYELQISEQKIKELEKQISGLNGKNFERTSEEIISKLTEKEKECIKFKSENIKLQLKVDELDEKIKTIISQKSETIALIESKNSEMIEKLKSDFH